MPEATAVQRSEDFSLAADPYRPAARFTAAVVVAVALFTALWFAWATVARHRLRRELDAIRATGDAYRAADFPSPPLADADNAAAVWRTASSPASTPSYSPSGSDLLFHIYPAYPPQWWTLARASEAANVTTIRLAHVAAALPRARWFDGPSTLLGNHGNAMPYNDLRNLSNVLVDSALLAHFGDHDDGRCLERFADALSLADAIEQQPSLLSRLVGIAIRDLAESRLLVVAPDLDVGRPDTPRRRLVRNLIDRLRLDPPTAVRTAPVMAERAGELDRLATAGATYPLIEPMADLSAVRFLRIFALDATAARAPDAPAALAVYAAAPRADLTVPTHTILDPILAPPRTISRRFDTWSARAFAMYTPIDWQARAHAHMTAVALAIAVYRADHAGRWPTHLADLVPQVLDVIPSDPTLAGAPPVAYVVHPHGRPDGGDRPVLNVGPPFAGPINGTVRPDPEFGETSRAGWFDLTRWDVKPTPVRPPTTGTGVPGM
jgi:hypothetical protein